MPLESSLFPSVIFRNTRGFTLANIGVFLIGILYYACLVVWPQQISSL
jgi:sulfite exporter TauE/SafE